MNWQFTMQIAPALLCNAGFLAAGYVCSRRWDLTIRMRSPLPIAILIAGIAAEGAFARLHGSFPHPSVQVAIAAVAAGAAFDVQTGYIFDAITFPALVLIFAFAVLSNTWPQALMGALSAGGAMGALYLLWRGRGMGLGDVKIAGCIGAGFGVAQSLEALGVAFVAGGVYAAALLITRRARRGSAVPFGPFIALGAYSALACGWLA